MLFEMERHMVTRTQLSARRTVDNTSALGAALGQMMLFHLGAIETAVAGQRVEAASLEVREDGCHMQVNHNDWRHRHS